MRFGCPMKPIHAYNTVCFVFWLLEFRKLEAKMRVLCVKNVDRHDSTHSWPCSTKDFTLFVGILDSVRVPPACDTGQAYLLKFFHRPHFCQRIVENLRFANQNPTAQRPHLSN